MTSVIHKSAMCSKAIGVVTLAASVLLVLLVLYVAIGAGRDSGEMIHRSAVALFVLAVCGLIVAVYQVARAPLETEKKRAMWHRLAWGGPFVAGWYLWRK